MSDHSPEPKEECPDLVAFLDGELDEDAARQVEARLAVDEAARREVDTLKRTWDLLDYLPRAEPSPSFTHRTLERISAQRQAAAATSRKRRRWGAIVGWSAGFAAAAAAGFAAMTLLVPREPTDEELVGDLRLLENKRLYEQVESLEFLKALDARNLFEDDAPGASGG